MFGALDEIGDWYAFDLIRGDDETRRTIFSASMARAKSSRKISRGYRMARGGERRALGVGGVRLLGGAASCELRSALIEL